jgi:hypothetical protein
MDKGDICMPASPSALTPDQQAWIYQQFNGTTYQANAMDVQHEPLYDTLTTTAGSTIAVNSQFFTNPGTKTLNLTNVLTAKRLDAPQAMAVMGICFSWQENILLADAVAIKANFALELWIGEKSYNRAPVAFYNYGSGIAGSSVVAGNSFFTNGTPMKGERHELAINIVIDNQASFYGNMPGVATTMTAAASGGTGSVLLMLLDGLHARGVQ